MIFREDENDKKVGIGKRFIIGDQGEFILAGMGGSCVALISLSDGRRWGTIRGSR